MGEFDDMIRLDAFSFKAVSISRTETEKEAPRLRSLQTT
jgi:hypothetical protein